MSLEDKFERAMIAMIKRFIVISWTDCLEKSICVPSTDDTEHL